MILKKDAFLPELEAIFNSLEYEENGGLVITSLTYIDDDLKILFTLSCGNDEIPKQSWELFIKDIKRGKFISEWVVYPEVYSNHFLLYEFIDSYVSLYYNGSTENPEKLFIDLYKLHIRLYNNLIEFGFGINAPDGMLKLCTEQVGLFAQGPKKILEQYQKCLSAINIQSNFINEIESEDTDLLLLIWGDSYFIGKEFNFKQLK